MRPSFLLLAGLALTACSSTGGDPASAGAAGQAPSSGGAGGTGANGGSATGGGGGTTTGGTSSGGTTTGGTSNGGTTMGGTSSGGTTTGGTSNGGTTTGGATSGGSGGTSAGGTAGVSGAGGSGGVTGREHCKRGVAYGHHSEADMAALSPGISWWYNWSDVPDAGVAAGAYRTLGVEYVPMVWGGNFVVSDVESQIPAGATTLLGFNEPNFYAQANLSATAAAALWPELEQIATARSLALVSPAVNFCGGGCHDTDPFNYLHDFFNACTGCQVDAIAVHVYVGCNVGGANHAQWLINHLENYKAQFTQPIWVTEFACDDAASLEEQRLFLVDAVTYLENEPRIARYAWFSGRADNVANASLLGADGQLTVLGDAYVTLPHAADCPL